MVWISRVPERHAKLLCLFEQADEAGKAHIEQAAAAAAVLSLTKALFHFGDRGLFHGRSLSIFSQTVGLPQLSHQATSCEQTVGMVLIADFQKERKMSNYTEQANVARFVDGDLVLARNGLNPQIRFAIGKIEGNDKPKGKVTLRLLHVLRAWSNDGHGRPDERLVQANHSGLGNYAEFLRSDVTTLSNEEVPLVLQMSASELEAQLSAQREVSNYIEQPINATIQAGVLTLPNGQSIDLTKVQAALNLGFQETGYHDLMVACDEMSKLTGLVQGPRGKLVPAADMQNAEMQYTGPDPIKGLRVIVDVSYIDGAIPRTKLIGLLAGAVQERMMVKDLKCGGVVFGFTTCYRDFRSDLNDSSLIRPQAESLRVKILARDNAQTDDSPVTTH